MNQSYKLEQLTQPASLIVSVATVKTFLRVDSSDEDTEIEAMIKSATRLAEQFCNKKFISQQWALWLDYFPVKNSNDWWEGTKEGSIKSLVSCCNEITIPIGPVISVDSVKTYDDSDTEYTFDSSNYYVDKNADYPRVVLRNSYTWPTTVLRAANGIKVTFTTGFSTVPEDIIHAIKLIVGKLYENRGDEKSGEGFTVPSTAMMLLSNHRQFRI